MINPEFCPSGPDAGNITVSDVEEDEEPENDQTMFTFSNFIWLLIYIVAFREFLTFDLYGFICNPRKFLRDEEARIKRQIQALNNSDSNLADTVKPDPEADSGSQNTIFYTINEVEEPADCKKNV